ncbi:MAG TPA: efflux RND transporter permease subunit, partial [bacterium]|nr:efflux RND transporter permease subunit [bacterium]
QSDTAKEAVKGFLVNLIEAVVIVVLVLLLTMGLRSGLIIGAVLFMTICGTFIFMDMWGVTLERISLGALIISLGMLVDNAIVVTDGMKVRMLQGKDALDAAKEVVGQTAAPLLGATTVAVIAFAAIGTSQDSTGEYCRTLFQVILISLMFSWVTAVTSTPLFCKLFLLGKKDRERAAGGVRSDPYAGGFYGVYRRFLCAAIKYRRLTVSVMLVLFAVSVYGFGSVDKSFFPPSSRPQYFVNFWMPKGTSIAATEEAVIKAEKYLMSRPETTHIATLVGGGEVRFLLTYPTEQPDRSYGQIIVSVKDFREIDKAAPQVQKELDELLPGALIEVKKFMLGPGDGGKIQFRVSGPDQDTVRLLAAKAKEVLATDGDAKNIRENWGNKAKVIRPQLEEAQARRLGIARPDVAEALLESYDGKKIGVYREHNRLIDILARAPQHERESVDALNALTIWSPAERTAVPLRQVVSGFKTEFEDEIIWRRDRRPTLTLHADPVSGQPSALFARVKPKIERAVGADFRAITGRDLADGEITAATVPLSYKNMFPIKGMPGYTFGWDGEAEDSAKANANLAKSIPVFFVIMVAIVICLFNAVRVPLIIWLTVPFSIIGVTLGLLAFRQPFSFMAILGFLSLSGMLIKTAIVLADEINVQLAAGKDPLAAVIDSGVSRLNPVFNAAATTMLGMIPLFQDIFFVPMAVTIVFGLGFATVLILVAVPVFYTMFFRIPSKEV